MLADGFVEERPKCCLQHSVSGLEEPGSKKERLAAALVPSSGAKSNFDGCVSVNGKIYWSQ